MIEERLKALVSMEGMNPAALAAASNIPKDRWQNWYYGKIRAGADMVEAAATIWPQYRYWLISGEVMPEAGQISPEIERKREDSKRAGEVTR